MTERHTTQTPVRAGRINEARPFTLGRKGSPQGKRKLTLLVILDFSTTVLLRDDELDRLTA